MNLDRQSFAELFEIACRGTLASAFYHTQTEPDEIQWEMLKGDREITMRDMGEISFATCVEFNMNLSAIPADEKSQQ